LDREALTRLETLYRDVGPDLLAYLRRAAGDLHTAEDLLHETFMQAARGLEGLPGAVSVRAWLYAIARHVAVTAYRRRRGMQSLPEVLADSEQAEDPRMERMRRAIAELPTTMREALELRLRSELSYDEIADVLQIPVGTVRSRLHAALQRLRATLRDAAEMRSA
jgi:RNA polymerase sigma-70 factor (ECF subfamily)